MKHRVLNTQGEQTHILVIDTGEEVTQKLLDFAKAQGITAGHFTAIGGMSEVVLGFLDFDRDDYHHIPVNEQVEVASLVGNFAEEEGSPALHAHVVVTLRDGTAKGGHLLSGIVRPTLEVAITGGNGHLQRRHNPSYGVELLTGE